MKRFWKPQKTTREETLGGAVARLKKVENLILKSQQDIMKKVQTADKQARAYVAKYPHMARSCLQQKQNLLTQHAQITKQLATVQQQLNGLEINMVTTEVVKGVQATHKALSATQVHNASGRVSDLLDATNDQMEEVQEIADVVGEAADPLDEDALDKEMAMLFEESLNPSALMNPIPELPKIPTPEPTPQKDVVEEMTQWANMQHS